MKVKFDMNYISNSGLFIYLTSDIDKSSDGYICEILTVEQTNVN